MINDLSMYVLRLLIEEKVVSQKAMKELKQLLGTTDNGSLRDITQVRIGNFHQMI